MFKIVNNSDSSGFVIGYPIADDGREVQFFSPLELKEFIENESQVWEWAAEIHDVKISGEFYRFVFLPLIRVLREILESWESNNSSFVQKTEYFEVLLEVLPFPFSTNSLGKLIINKAESDNKTAFWLLFLSCYPRTNQSQADYDVFKKHYNRMCNTRLGSNNALILLDNLPELFAANRILANFEMQTQNINGNAISPSFLNEISAFKDCVAAIKNEYKSLGSWQESNKTLFISDFRNTTQDLKQKAEEFLLNCKERADQTHSEVLEKLASAESAYREKISIAESTKYWENKTKGHWKGKNFWLSAITLFIGIASYVPFWVFGRNFFGSLPQDKLLLGFIHPANLVVSILLLSLTSYGIRFCSCQFASHQHLYLESLERSTMMMTYLALMKENKLSEPEDRKIALETLFRPAKTGMIADHGPVVPTETIVNVIEKRVSSQG
ncbi:MAG: hypothetical protein C0410_13715 [Anaerolinea sp.]|nr:hypothetical protein [Anaerolinea sp.]